MTKSLFHGEGYLLCDDTASGGLKTESGLVACNHCQVPMKKHLWKSGATGAYCPRCDSPLCDSCAQRYRQFGCEPYLKKFTAMLEDHYRKEQNRKILGT